MAEAAEHHSRVIKVDYLARVEGEGALYLRIENDRLAEAQLKIFEPPRFFEAFLRGRHFREAPDITSRICGICPIAYQLGAAQAMEQILDLKVSEPVRLLRRLIYCGEWIESHVLHIYMLHAPDFLGYDDAVGLARDFPDLVRRGLRLKKVGNDLMKLLGGREIHPINLRVGGFYRLPERPDLLALRPELEWAVEAATQTVKWVTGFAFPELERDNEYVALHHRDEYAIHEGKLISSRGLDIPISDFEAHFEEEHVARSNALHCVHKGYGAYLVGPLARFNLNFSQLTPQVQALAEAAGLAGGCRNPFKSIIVRSLEVLYVCQEALRLLDAYIAGLVADPAPLASLEAPVRAGTGYGCTEAPRGICWHRYEIDAQGLITQARIIPPTSQNQKSIEADLYTLAAARLTLDDASLRGLCEQAIRNYDPCISCATHFLKLEIERR
ncbi:MAG: Ni/Fe hydrogenase subunit alpha [Candidatus Sericytochromatia bacterium]